MANITFPDGSSTSTNDSEPGSRDAAWRQWHLERGRTLPPELMTDDDLRAEADSLKAQLAEALAKIAVYEAPVEEPVSEPEVASPSEPGSDVVEESAVSEPDSTPTPDASAGTAGTEQEPATVGDEPAAPDQEMAPEQPEDASAGSPDVEPEAPTNVDSESPSEPVIPPATPAAVAHADELGVDLNQVEGSGADGKILKSDVAAAADSTQESNAQSS